MRKGLYPASTYDPACPVGSYWDSTIADPGWRHPAPLQEQVGAEVVIVGGGLTGLSTALHLARDHGISACLLEAGSLGWGASGRNGGFCGVGSSHLTHTQMVRRVGLAETERYYRDQWQAVETVRELAASEGFSLEAQGQGCYAVAHRPQAWSELEAEYLIYTQVAGYPAQLLNPKELRERGFNSQENHGALHIGVGFGLNPLKLTQGLAQAAHRWGAKLYSGSPVTAWEKVGSQHICHTPGGTVRARHLVIATNGYTPEALYPQLAGSLLPALSNILVTRPLTPQEQKAQGWWDPTPLYDMRRLLFYYRLLPDGRLLFGGAGRHPRYPDGATAVAHLDDPTALSSFPCLGRGGDRVRLEWTGLPFSTVSPPYWPFAGGSQPVVRLGLSRQRCSHGGVGGQNAGPGDRRDPFSDERSVSPAAPLFPFALATASLPAAGVSLVAVDGWIASPSVRGIPLFGREVLP
jgi:glycine/D-amino acid oxidase-like deaminating enzyme